MSSKRRNLSALVFLINLITKVNPIVTLIPKNCLRTVPTIVIAHRFSASQSRYSDFLSVMLTNTEIFLHGLKLSGESRS